MDQAFALEAGGALLEHFGVAVQAVVERVRGVDLEREGLGGTRPDGWVSSARLFVFCAFLAREMKGRRTSAAAWRVPRGGSNSVSSRRRNKGFSVEACSPTLSRCSLPPLVLQSEVKVAAAAAVKDEAECCAAIVWKGTTFRDCLETRRILVRAGKYLGWACPGVGVKR